MVKIFHFPSFLLTVDATLAEKRKEDILFPSMCRIIDSLIRQMNWSTPAIVVPIGTPPFLVHSGIFEAKYLKLQFLVD